LALLLFYFSYLIIKIIIITTSDSIEKDGTYLYSENINTFNPEFIEVSPDTKNIIKTGEEIKFILPDVE